TVLRAYDLLGDDGRMRAITSLPADEQGAWFDRLRKEYPVRREFFNTRIRLTRADERLARILSGVGFALI
ncbi:MAG TPA: DUF3410 domain-containing protein, partial [Candidatus Hydrogenedentes bacterium]|nr:DUF3410 domain-containing protein [Candidatus Hydrogenedentota bacterium]